VNSIELTVHGATELEYAAFNGQEYSADNPMTGDLFYWKKGKLGNVNITVFKPEEKRNDSHDLPLSWDGVGVPDADSGAQS
jgi:hypothetical protein